MGRLLLIGVLLCLISAIQCRVPSDRRRRQSRNPSTRIWVDARLTSKISLWKKLSLSMTNRDATPRPLALCWTLALHCSTCWNRNRIASTTYCANPAAASREMTRWWVHLCRRPHSMAHQVVFLFASGVLSAARFAVASRCRITKPSGSGATTSSGWPPPSARSFRRQSGVGAAERVRHIQDHPDSHRRWQKCSSRYLRDRQ